MPINYITGSTPGVADQELAVTQRVLAAETDKVKNKETEPVRETRKTLIAELSAGKGSNVGLKVLRELVHGLAASGLDLATDKISQKAKFNAKDEYDLLLERKEDGGDQIELSVQEQAIKQIKKNHSGRSGEEGQGSSGQPSSSDVKELTREYINCFSKFLVSGSAELKKKADELEAKLESKGVSPKELLSLKAAVKNSIRGEVLTQVKDAFVNRLFIEKENSMSYVIANRSLDEVLNFATGNQRLGKEDFGGYKAGLENALREIATETKQEVREYVKEELTGHFIEAKLNMKGDEAAVRSLINLGQKVGFDEEAFVQEWQKKHEDLGLSFFSPPPPAGSNANADQQQQKAPSQEEVVVQEKDLLSNQLRAIYMQRAIKGDYLTMLQTSFRMRKLKNGLIKLGMKIEDFKHLEQEGREVAVLRCKEMLEEVLAERATMYELAGPALRLIETRVRGIQQNLERLGAPLASGDIELMIEKIDVKIHDLAMEELTMVEGVLKSGKNEAAEKKRGQLVKLITRLRAEAKIAAPEISLAQVSDRA